MSIEFTAHADVDVDTTTDSILADLGLSVATAFQHRLQVTLTGLEGLPHSAPLVDPPYPNYPGMRVRPVYRFRARLVFYLPTPTGILVVRLIHASRNLDDVFG